MMEYPQYPLCGAPTIRPHTNPPVYGPATFRLSMLSMESVAAPPKYEEIEAPPPSRRGVRNRDVTIGR